MSNTFSSIKTVLAQLVLLYLRFYESLLITQRKNEELICTLEDAGMQIERLECTGEGDPNSLMGIIDTLR